MTPEEIAKRIVDARFYGASYMSIYTAPELIADIAAAINDTLERAAETALVLGWRADASDAMRIAATSIAARIRALKTEPSS